MTRIAIYPGSFDPPTRGHEDLIRRALALADQLIVAVAINPNKAPLFSVEDRLRMLKVAAAGDPRVELASFSGLLADFARDRNATMVVRGLRAVSDFEYEFQMALMNRKLNDRLETVFLVPAVDLTYLSSSLVREVAQFGGPLDGLVSQTASAGVILAAAALGGPVSASHVVASSVVGVGTARRRLHVHWEVVTAIALSWLVTMPAAAVLAATTLPLWRWLA